MDDDNHFYEKHVLLPYSSRLATATTLFAASSPEDDDDDNDNDDTSSSSSSPTLSRLERLKMSGVSVSPNGFHVILQRNLMEGEGQYIPIKVTNNIQDAFAATYTRISNIMSTVEWCRHGRCYITTRIVIETCYLSY